MNITVMNELLPEEGILTIGGNLFHHEKPLQYTEEAHKRLEEFGIETRKKNLFTVEETCIIMKNWKKYAEKIRIPVTDALNYFGLDRRKSKADSKAKFDNNFYADLCKGLPHRSALQVYRRAHETCSVDFLKTHESWDDEDVLKSLVFDNFYHKSATNISDEVKNEIIKLKNEGNTTREIADELNVRFRQVCAIVSRHKMLEKSAKSIKYQVLWKSLIKNGLNDRDFKRALRKNDKEALENIEKTIDFEKIARETTLSLELVKETWINLVKKAHQKFEEFCGEYTKREAAKVTLTTLVDREGLTPEQHRAVMEILCKIVKKEDMIHGSETFNQEKLAKKLKERNITGIRQSCVGSCFEIIMKNPLKQLKKFDDFVFDRLMKGFSVRAKLHFIFWGMKKRSDWKGKSTGDILRNTEENQKEHFTHKTIHFLQNDVTKKWLQEPFPSKTYDMITSATEAFVIYCNYTYEVNFVFPTKLHYLIESEIVKNLLPKEENNSDYLNSKEVKLTEMDDSIENKLKRKIVYKPEASRNSQKRVIVEEKVDDEFVPVKKKSKKSTSKAVNIEE